MLAAVVGVVTPIAALVESPASASGLPACGTGGLPTVTALADPVFYIDTSSGLDATYGGYTVRAGATAEEGLWLSLSGFTGGVVTLAPSQPSAVALPNLAPTTATSAYALLRASAATATPQTHTVTLFRGDPTSGTALCSRTFTYNSVAETIKALANKVTGVTADVPATAEIGDVVNVTVTGTTGTLGAGPGNDPGVLSYAPAALSAFPAGAWRLERTQMEISPDGVLAAHTYVDRLFLSGASGPNRPYTAQYRFRAIGPSATAAAVAPVQYIASGTQVKHTDVGGSVTGALPTISSQGKVVLSKSASPATTAAAGGTVTYTVAIQNMSTTTARLDRIVDTLPVGSTYVASSTTLGGVAQTDPTLASGKATWRGPIDVAAGSTLALVYQLSLPAVAGRYANSVVGSYGNVTLDASRDVTFSDPAVAEVVVPAASGTANAVDDTASTTANTPTTVNVTSNDTSTLGGPLTVTAVGSPSSGTASISGASVVYTPAAGFAGQATLTYTLSDSYTTDTATVTVTVSPVANADSYVTGKNVTLSGGTVLANDLCTGCTVTQVGSLAGLTLASGGTFTYVPANNFTGTVTFTYRVTASGGGTADALVTIFVGNAAPDFATTPYDTNVSIAVTANDTCPGSCNFNLNNNVVPTHGTVTASGSNAVYDPSTGFVGVDQFSYTGTGNTSATGTVLVGPPPTSLTTTFGVPVSGSLADASFLGVSTVACSGCAWTLLAAPGGGSASVASDGTVTYVPGPSFAGSTTFTYRITHPASGLAVTGTVDVTVGPAAADDQANVLLGQSVAIDLGANDSCPATCTVTVLSGPVSGSLSGSGSTRTYITTLGDQIGDVTFTYQVASSLAPTATDAATVTVHVDGAVADTASTSPGQAVVISVQANDPCTSCTVSALSTPTAGAVSTDGTTVTYTPPAGFSGTATFIYTVSRSGHSTTAAVTVTVLPDATDDNVATATGTAVDLDPRTNDICLGCTVQSVGFAVNGSASVVGGTLVRFTPSGSNNGAFVYTVVDRDGNTATANVFVTVMAPPSATDDSAVTDAGAPAIVPVLGNDACTGCSASVLADPAHGTVSVRADGSLQYTPTAGFSGVDVFTYLVTDPTSGLSAAATVSIEVRPMAADDVATTPPGAPVTTDVLANDACTSCTIAVTPPSSGTAVVTNGGVQYTPAPGFQGVVTIGYTATDPATGRTTSATLTITVSAATADAATTAFETPATIDVLANDSNCAGCILTAVSAPSHGTAMLPGVPTDPIAYAPAAGFFGLDTFTYTATTADQSLSSTVEVRVLVAPPSRTVVVDVGGSTTGSLLTGGVCVGCVFSLVTPPADGEITLNTDGTWSYQAPPSGQPTDAAVYRITDPVSGMSVTGTLTLEVRPSSVTVVAAVTNDNGGVLTPSGVTLRLEGTPVTSGITTTRPAGSTNTVTWDVPAGYASTGVSCQDGSSAVAHPVLLAAGAAVTCTVAFDDLSNAPALTLTKSAGTPVDTNANGRVDAGEHVTYTYVITNAGNASVSGITLADDKIPSLASSCTVPDLAVGASHTCTATYSFTQADVDAGSVTNTATATGSSGGTVTGTDSATVTITRTSTVGATKVVLADHDLDSDGRIGPGDTIEFRITATNTGNTSLTGVTIGDSPDSHTCGAMAPAATCSYDVTRIVTQADVDAGGVANTATVSAVGPVSATPFTTDASVTAPVTATPPVLSVVKTATGSTDADSSGSRTVGDTLHYAITVTNTGQKTATGVTLEDTVTGDSTACPDLAPTATCTLNADLLVTEAMALTGSVQNDAVAHAANAADGTASLTTSLVRPVGIGLTNELLLLDRTVAGRADRVDAGDVASYRIVVTNTGLAPITGLTVGSAAGTPNCGGVTSLAPSASVVCNVNHVVSQGDIDAGAVGAGATAAGTSSATALTASAPRVTALPAVPALTLAATVSAGGCPSADETVTVAAGTSVRFCYTVTNLGNVTVGGVKITDPIAGLTETNQPVITAGSTTLAPGASFTAVAPRSASASATYVVTATGHVLGGGTVSAVDSAAVAVVPAAGLDITGVVWFDTDRDGVRDANEALLPGAAVRLQPTSAGGPLALHAAADAALASGDGGPVVLAATLATTLTDRDGAYRFTGVGPGSFTLVATAAANGLSPHSDTDGGTDWSVNVTVLSASVEADFAAAGAGAVAGTVTSRLTTRPIADATVACTWPGLDGVAGTDDDVRFTTTTDASGRYSVDGVPYGEVTCGFTDPTTNESTTVGAVVAADTVGRADAVLGAGGSLPRTGGAPMRELVIGALLIAMGAALVLGSRSIPGRVRR